jgi:hypothetical protein
MAETRIADVIVPEVFTNYTLEPSIFKSRFFLSGALRDDPALSALLTGGGSTFNLPYWQDVDHTESDLPSETVATTINPLTASSQIAVRLEREKAWGANNISALLAGSNPLQSIGDRVITYWTQDYDKTVLDIANGVIADNIVNDASDLVNVTATPFDDDGVIDAQALLGENGTIGRQDLNNGDFVGIAVHPDQYALMRKNDLITFVAISEQIRPVPTYMGMNVIVDRNLLLSVGVYTSIIFKAGAFAFGQSSTGFTPTEIDRRPGIGFGTDDLYTRRVYGLHPGGFQFVGTPAGISPTNAELAVATSWDRVFEKENIGFVAYKSTIV